MTAAASNEQRRFSRIKFVSVSTLQCGSRALRVKLIDIALRGALVEAEQALPPVLEQECCLMLSLDGAEQRIEMHGRIVHQEGTRLGVECRAIDVDSLTLLRRMLELNLGDPNLVDRELSQLFSGADPS
jgi:hypothetical protein